MHKMSSSFNTHLGVTHLKGVPKFPKNKNLLCKKLLHSREVVFDLCEKGWKLKHLPENTELA